MPFNSPFSNKKKDTETVEKFTNITKIESTNDKNPHDKEEHTIQQNFTTSRIPTQKPQKKPITVPEDKTTEEENNVFGLTEPITINETPTMEPLGETKQDIETSEFFNKISSEEEEFYEKKKNNNLNHYVYSKDPVLNLLIKNSKELQKKYPSGGLKQSRFLTTEVLLKAERGYFRKYYKDVAKGVQKVQYVLSSTQTTEEIEAARTNPTDETLQNIAYSRVRSLASEYAQETIWRDIERQLVISMICDEILGFSRLEPLWRDNNIDEIICNGPNDIQAEIKGTILKIPGCEFDSQKHLSNYIEKMYRTIGKQVSLSHPLVKGRLYDMSRMFAVHESVAPDGPNLSIRRHPDKIWTPKELVEKRNAASPEVMSYIGNLIYKGASALVIGGTHSGKTTMLNAITGFYKPHVRILTLEDNLEMRPNPNKYLAAAMECREPQPDRPNDKGITMRDLVKSSLQLRPDVIIVGEVTDSAAYDLCQALNTGHAGASTVHANNSKEAIPRLASLISQSNLSNPESSLDLISAAFDIIINVKHFPVDGSRRIVSIDEVGTIPKVIDGRLTLETKQLWKFVDEGLDENRKIVGHWEQVSDISDERVESKLLNIESDKTWEELQKISYVPGQE